MSFGEFGSAGIMAFDVSPEATSLTLLHQSDVAPNIVVGEDPIQLDPNVQNNTPVESDLTDTQMLIVGENIYVRYDGNTPIPGTEPGRWDVSNVTNSEIGQSFVGVFQRLQAVPFCNEFPESGEVPSTIQGLRRYSREVPYTTEHTSLYEWWYYSGSGVLTRFRETFLPSTRDEQGDDVFIGSSETTFFDIGIVRPIAIPTFDRDEYSFEFESSPVVGTIIGSTQVLDVEQYSESPYAISEGNSDGLFAIDATTGEISITREFAEGENLFELSVAAARADGGSDSVQVKIGIGV